MSTINRHNVGRIAERIVANELEFAGFRVSDLNKEGISANADLLAAKDGLAVQIQVKGSTWDGWWFGYGHCTEEMISHPARKFFNRSTGNFYKAEYVILVCVKGPAEYQCIVLPVDLAEEAVQRNLERCFRGKKKDGSAYRPGKMWVSLEWPPKESEKRAEWDKEVELLKPFLGRWQTITASPRCP